MTYGYRDHRDPEKVPPYGAYITTGVVVFIALVAGGMWGCPQYSVYSARMEGTAKLAEAENGRKTKIEEARAANEAATMQAEARVKQAEAEAKADSIRAIGVAASNRIIGQSLRDNPDYLRWLYIQQLDKAQTVYIPTEAGFPILQPQRKP